MWGDVVCHIALVLAPLLSKTPPFHPAAVRGRYLEKVSITECPSLAHDPISYEDGDSCCHSFSLSQEKLKPQYLEQLPVQLKQFSLFLGKFSWFAGEKVGRKEGKGEDTFLSL